MFVRLTAAVAALCMLGGSAFAQSAAKPTDPQIAHIAYTAGVIDVANAKQALARSKNKTVREFAQDMVRDHEAVINRRWRSSRSSTSSPRTTTPAAR